MESFIAKVIDTNTRGASPDCGADWRTVATGPSFASMALRSHIVEGYDACRAIRRRKFGSRGRRTHPRLSRRMRLTRSGGYAGRVPGVGGSPVDLAARVQVTRLARWGRRVCGRLNMVCTTALRDGLIDRNPLHDRTCGESGDQAPGRRSDDFRTRSDRRQARRQSTNGRFRALVLLSAWSGTTGTGFDTEAHEVSAREPVEGQREWPPMNIPQHSPRRTAFTTEVAED